MSKSESIVNSINDDSNNDDGLPSYDDVLREEQARIQAQTQTQGRISSYGSNNSGSSNGYLNVPPPPKRPPQKPPRPNSSSHASSTSSLTSNLRPPVPRPSVASSSSTLSQSIAKPSSNNARPRIPWVYPSNFHCPKCNNTGYKLKNGKSCRSCWRRFCPKNPINYNMGPTSSSFYVSPSMGLSSPYPPPMNSYGYGYGYPPAPAMPIPPPPPPQQHPLVVRPGDPRLGGVLCGECRGTGRISFLLDDDLCPLCNGLGRIVSQR
ncbi:Hua1p PWA37_003911 [Arxiozyma heterogenica]|uniref:Hua1p n=1 Tax=Arxiozyma heterogenica TaxID=278026 RepID=UPI002EE371C0